MPLPRWVLLPAACSLLVAAATGAQVTHFSEDFDGVFPPAGWQVIKANGHPGRGWQQSLDLRAWHEDEFAVGPTRDLLQTVGGAVDLSQAGAAYLHFYNELAHADHLAHHPFSVGIGVNDVGVSTDQWQTRTTVWTETRIHDGVVDTVIDLNAWVGQVIDLRFHFYGDFDQEWWIDEIVVNEDPQPRVPPATDWHVPQLPAAFTAVPYLEDFEAHAGVPPPWMALNATDTAFAPDPEAWCSIAGGSFPAFSGSRCLEMGLDPGSLNAHLVRNACVIGIDGNGATELLLEFRAVDFGEEPHAFDGVWISADGTGWYAVHARGDWGAQTGVPGAWELHDAIALGGTPVDVGGPFYLMFGQEDDWPYALGDGIGVDDLRVTPPPPPPPHITLSGSCGSGPVTLSASGLTPAAAAGLVVGPGGSHLVPAGNCAGTLMDTGPSLLRRVLVADALGNASLHGSLPAAACGTMVVQVLDLSTCAVSNVLPL